MSNALEKSTKTAKTDRLLSREENKLDENRLRASKVLCPDLKPNCELLIIFLSSKYLVKFIFINSSKILEKMLRVDMGRKLLVSVLGPDLCIGVIFAFFNMDGNLPVRIDWLKSRVRG